MINIKGLDKAKVLKALYDGSHVQGFGLLQEVSNFTEEDARNLLRKTFVFDYLHGRVMKVDLSSNITFEEWFYDRDNGIGAAQGVIEVLRMENM